MFNLNRIIRLRIDPYRGDPIVAMRLKHPNGSPVKLDAAMILYRACTPFKEPIAQTCIKLCQFQFTRLVIDWDFDEAWKNTEDCAFPVVRLTQWGVTSGLKWFHGVE